MVGLTAVSGCVVTDKIEFYEPVNSPPVFPAGEQPLQLGQIIFVDKDEGSSRFTFRVRDADIDQELKVRWRILRNVISPNEGTQVEQRKYVTLPLSGTDTRDFDIVVDPTQLTYDNCHRIEIAVSGSFREPFPGAEPAFLDLDDRADLTQFSFWIWEGEPTAPAAAKLVETTDAKSFQPVVLPTGAAGSAAEGAPP